MKRILCLLLCLLTLIACQPTPRSDVVTNKAEGRLEALIVSAPEASASPEETIRTRVGAPEHMTDSVSGKVYGGTMDVTIDAAVTVPDVAAVPVYRAALVPSAP